jgi:hypothetical protein
VASSIKSKGFAVASNFAVLLATETITTVERLHPALSAAGCTVAACLSLEASARWLSRGCDLALVDLAAPWGPKLISLLSGQSADVPIVLLAEATDGSTRYPTISPLAPTTDIVSAVTQALKSD